MPEYTFTIRRTTEAEAHVVVSADNAEQADTWVNHKSDQDDLFGEYLEEPDAIRNVTDRVVGARLSKPGDTSLPHFSVAPTPEGWAERYPCGCSFQERCTPHGLLVRLLRRYAWDKPHPDDRNALGRVWAQCDTYGPAGTVPPQDLDWSGIRDATPVTIERMAQALLG